MRTLTRAQRKTAILAAWRDLVGELPANGDSLLPGLAKLYGFVPAVRAIERCADNDQLDSSDDVLEAVQVLLRTWDKRGWCTPDYRLIDGI